MKLGTGGLGRVSICCVTSRGRLAGDGLIVSCPFRRKGLLCIIFFPYSKTDIGRPTNNSHVAADAMGVSDPSTPNSHTVSLKGQQPPH